MIIIMKYNNNKVMKWLMAMKLIMMKNSNE